MALDFPRAWELARAAEPGAHHPQCSYLATEPHGAFLCDEVCPVIADAPEFQCAAMHSRGGQVTLTAPPYGPCPGHLQTR
jgi:hypothetical protein